MIRLGITGGIAAGKSTVAAMFAAPGTIQFNADQAVHVLYNDPEMVALLKTELSMLPCDERGRVDRPALAMEIRRQPALWDALESALHPLVYACEDQVVCQARRMGYTMVISDIPLLLESGASRRYDATCLVTAPLWLRRQRALRRPGMQPEWLEMILQRQLLPSIGQRQVDWVITTGLGLADTRRQVERLRYSALRL